LTDRASAHIQEAFNLFLSAVDAADVGFENVNDILLDDEEDGE
jgi:hypothetical protein